MANTAKLVATIGYGRKGDFNSEEWLNKLKSLDFIPVVEALAQEGVYALEAATPVRTGLTARSWDFKIEQDDNAMRIIWTNSNKTKTGDAIVFLLQYGHGTRNGGYVVGRDFINPAIAPIFDQIEDAVLEVIADA